VPSLSLSKSKFVCFSNIGAETASIRVNIPGEAGKIETTALSSSGRRR
jgi:hypothetical protein